MFEFVTLWWIEEVLQSAFGIIPSALSSLQQQQPQPPHSPLTPTCTGSEFLVNMLSPMIAPKAMKMTM